MTSKIVFCFDPEDDSRAEKIISSFSPEIFSLPPLETRQNLSDETITQLLEDSDFTVVFIGKHTFENGRCLKMIEDSFSRGNAFLAIYLNNAEDVKKSGKELLGKNPFELFYFEYNNNDKTTIFNSGSILLPNKLKRRLLSKDIKAKADFVVTYDYIKDNGAENLLKWIEEEHQRKADFFEECDKIKENEWDSALKVTYKSNIAGFFLYYHWLTYSERKKGKEELKEG